MTDSCFFPDVYCLQQLLPFYSNIKSQGVVSKTTNHCDELTA